MLEAEDKSSILVTGATSGIGLELVRSLSKKYKMVLVGRDAEKLAALERELLGDHVFHHCDLEEDTGISELCGALPTDLRGFVHCAGREFTGPVRSISADKFKRYFNLHVFSYLQIIGALEKEKSIAEPYVTNVVYLSSVASTNGGAMQSLYSASKAAAEALSLPLTRELARKKFRINAVKPGLVDTPMTARWGKRVGMADAGNAEINGMASTAQIVSAIIFFLNNHDHHISGTSLVIDGGGSKISLG